MADDLGEEWWLDDKQLSENEECCGEVDNKQTKETDHKIKQKNGLKSKKILKIKNKKLTDKSGKKTKLKRKAEDSSSESEEDKDSVKPAKKKKTKSRKKISEELEENKPVPGKPEDFLNILKKTYEGKLSQVEWDDLELSREDFLDCNDTVDSSPVIYLKKIFPTWEKLVKKSKLPTGSPLLLFITNSGARAVELNREIKDFKGQKCRCVKLFAKHFKVEEQQKFLKNKICHIGVGTPQRIEKLIKLGSLKLDRLVAVIIDWNWRNIKFKRIVDIPEIKKDLLELFKNCLITHIKNSSCKMGLL